MRAALRFVFMGLGLVALSLATLGASGRPRDHPAEAFLALSLLLLVSQPLLLLLQYRMGAEAAVAGGGGGGGIPVLQLVRIRRAFLAGFDMVTPYAIGFAGLVIAGFWTLVP